MQMFEPADNIDLLAVVQEWEEYYVVLHSTPPSYVVLPRTTSYSLLLLSNTAYYRILLRTTEYFFERLNSSADRRRG